MLPRVMVVKDNASAAGDIANVELLRKQDAGAFALLVERHQALVLGLCQSLGLKGADIDDGASEVFAAVYRALPGFDGRSELSTWVYTIACRCIVRLRKRLRRHPTEELPAQLPAKTSVSVQPSLDDREVHERLWRAVARLETRQAMAVELFYRRQWPVEKVALVMQCPAGTVKTLLFRARRRLAELLDP
ncbi:MAG: RNA polymerase sigma factor [Phycisphaerae bacterium]